MKLQLGFVSPRRTKSKITGIEELVAEYATRAARLLPTEVQRFDSEEAFMAEVIRQRGKGSAELVLLDARGEMLSSEQFAQFIRHRRDGGVQRVMFGIGPAGGWSMAALGRADMGLSLGPMTLPHELARVVLAEQVYRALTILAGHPYHSGH